MPGSENSSFVTPIHSEQSQDQRSNSAFPIDKNYAAEAKNNFGMPNEAANNCGPVQVYHVDQVPHGCPLQDLTVPNTNLLPVQFCPTCPQHQEGYHEVSVQEPVCTLSPSQINVMSLDFNQCPQGYEIQQYVEVPSQPIAVRCCRTRSELALSDTCVPVTFIDECDRGYLNILGLQSVGSGDSETTVASKVKN